MADIKIETPPLWIVGIIAVAGLAAWYFWEPAKTVSQNVDNAVGGVTDWIAGKLTPIVDAAHGNDPEANSSKMAARFGQYLGYDVPAVFDQVTGKWYVDMTGFEDKDSALFYIEDMLKSLDFTWTIKEDSKGALFIDSVRDNRA